VRDANEAIERANVALPAGSDRLPLRCECGDPGCLARIEPSHAEYEAVRGFGSHFLVDLNHENPESACVLSEHGTYAVIDVVAAGVRYAVLRRNPRHAWTAAAGEGRR
jgi:hypothetical protein